DYLYYTDLALNVTPFYFLFSDVLAVLLLSYVFFRVERYWVRASVCAACVVRLVIVMSVMYSDFYTSPGYGWNFVMNHALMYRMATKHYCFAILFAILIEGYKQDMMRKRDGDLTNRTRFE